MAEPKVLSPIPWIACDEVLAMIAFFVEKLGFAQDWTWGEPPTDGGVCRDNARVYLFTNAELAARAHDTEISFPVEDVDALYAEHQRRGAPIAMEITNEPWGVREYHVRTPNGVKLRFGGEISEA